MNGMYPFKKRYLLLIIPIVVVIGICIYRTDAKYEDVVEIKTMIGEEFEFGETTVSVESVELVGSEYIEKNFADNPILLSMYESVYKGEKLVMAKIDAKGVNHEIFWKMIGSWKMCAGVRGSSTSVLSDFASGEFTEEKEDREIIFFFNIDEEWLEDSDNQIVIMPEYYPVQHNIYVDLSE